MNKLFRWIKDNPASSALRSLVTLAFAGLFTLISIATNGYFLIVVLVLLVTCGLVTGFFILMEAADQEKYNRRTKD